MSDEEIKTLFNIVDKLEKRIFLLEKNKLDKPISGRVVVTKEIKDE